MLIAHHIRINPRYIKPKYGSGNIFSSFIKLITKAASSVVKNRTLRKGLNDAIAGGKKVLSEAATSGKQLARESIEKGYFKKPLDAVINLGTEQLAKTLNKGVESSTNLAKNTIDKTLTNHPVAQKIANTLIDSISNKAKEIGEQSISNISKDLLQRTGTKRKRAQGTTTTKKKKKKKSSKGKKRDWGDVGLNSLIARV